MTYSLSPECMAEGRGMERMSLSKVGGCLGGLGGRWVVAERIVPSVDVVDAGPVREKVESGRT